MDKRGLILGLGLILGFGLVGASTYAENVTFSADIEYSLAMTLSDNEVALSINPLTTPFAEGSMSATVMTNNPYGYYASAVAPELQSSLYRNGSEDDYTIPTLAWREDGYTEDDFEVNRWGYKIDDGNYNGFMGQLGFDTYNYPTNGRTTTLGFAAKADFTQPAGTYTITMNFQSVVNVLNPDTNMNMQSVNQTVLDGMTAGDIYSMRDSRTGRLYDVSVFDFGGTKMLWMNDNLKLEPGTTLHPSDSNVSGDFTLSTEEWVSDEQDYYCKQIMAKVDTDEDGIEDEYYYNWYAATANPNTDYSAMNDNLVGVEDPTLDSCATEVKHAKSLGDICPKGWKIMPGEVADYEPLWPLAIPTLNYDKFFLSGSVSDSWGDAFGAWTSRYEGHESNLNDYYYYYAYADPFAYNEDNGVITWFGFNMNYGGSVRCIYLNGELPAVEEPEEEGD